MRSISCCKAMLCCKTILQSLWITYCVLDLKIQTSITIVKHIVLFGVIQFHVNVTNNLHVSSAKVNSQKMELLNELITLFIVYTKSTNELYLLHVIYWVQFSAMASFPDFETFGYKIYISSKVRLIANTFNVQLSSGLHFF